MYICMQIKYNKEKYLRLKIIFVTRKNNKEVIMNLILRMMTLLIRSFFKPALPIE